MYNGKPQIKIGDFWSYDEWGLLLNSGWSLNPASVKSVYVDIPAGDGALDMTEALAGEPRYNNRQLNFSLVFKQPEAELEDLRMAVENYCNGQKMKIVLPHDQDHYLIGRISTGQFVRQKGTAELSFTVDCEPWRYKTNITHVDVVLNGGGTYTGSLSNERRRVIPEITTTDNIDIKINNVTISVAEGTYKFTDLILNEGDNGFTVTSTNAGTPSVTVDIKYQEANL